MRHRTRQLALAALLSAFALALAACAGEGETLEGAADNGDDADVDGDGGEAGSSLADSTIVVGSKDFDEQLVLGYITLHALEDAGATVTDEINLGGTDAARQALEGGQIDVYWEYNGTAWISFFGETEPLDDEREQYEVVRDQDLEEADLVWMEPTPFNNTYALAMNQDRYAELGEPATLSDIGPLLEEDPDLSICVEAEFEVRDDGLPGMEETYGYSFSNVISQDLGIIYDQIAEGACDFGEVFTTDGRIVALDLVVLEDDQAFFPPYNASPVFRAEIYDAVGDELDEIFNPIAEALTNEEIGELNAQVSAENREPTEVAREWLEENGYIGG